LLTGKIKKEGNVVDNINVTEKDGKKYFVFADSTEALIENDIINNPEWVDIKAAAAMLVLGDRQTRNKAVDLNWSKKYASIRNRPALYLNKPEIEKYIKENPRTTHASFIKPESQEFQHAEETASKGLQTIESKEQFEAMLKTISPHIKEFVESHQKDRERLRDLEDKKGVLEKSAAIWKTSLFWLIGVSIFAGGVGWSSHKELSSKLSELSNEISSKDQELSSKDNELSQVKTSLTQKDTELRTLEAVYKIKNIDQNTVKKD